MLILNILHVLNDGLLVCLALLLPYLAESLSLTLAQVGLLSSLSQVVGIVISLPAGILAARYGNLRVLLLAAIMYGMGFVGISISASFLWLLLPYLFAGVGFALFHPVAFAAVIRRQEGKAMGRGFSTFLAIGDVGKIIFSLGLSLVVVAIGWVTTAFALGVGVLLIIAVIMLMLNRFRVVRSSQAQPLRLSLASLMRLAIRDRMFRRVVMTGFLDTIASNSLYIFLPFIFAERGAPAAFLGSLTAVFFVGNILGKVGFGTLVDKMSHRRLFVLAEGGMALLLFLLGVVSSLWISVAIAILLGILTKGTVPVIKLMAVGEKEHQEQMETRFGILETGSNIANTFAPLMLGVTADILGIDGALYLSAGMACLAIAPFALHRTLESARHA